MKSAILKIQTIDRPGLVAQITNFIFTHGGNILNLDQHTDTAVGEFFARVEWDLANFQIEDKNLNSTFAQFFAAEKIDGKWEIFRGEQKVRAAIFVSRTEHCLLDLLWRTRAEELPLEIVAVISNHEILRNSVENAGVKFFHVSVDAATKNSAEEKQLQILRDQKVDCVILARYMQILSPQFVAAFENKIINIHHSFLPAFKGADPYRRAHERGVKIIGATAHFVNADLDRGPIISQNVAHISHRETVTDLIARGRDVERITLSAAVKLFVQHRVFISGRRTVVL